MPRDEDAASDEASASPRPHREQPTGVRQMIGSELSKSGGLGRIAGGARCQGRRRQLPVVLWGGARERMVGREIDR